MSDPRPLVICDVDERVRVDPMTSPPYNWICSLLITAKGTQYEGSGFRVHIPNMNCFAIFTVGHNIYLHSEKSYADSIEVTFPGEPPVTAHQANMFAADEFVASADSDYDYGLLTLPGNSDEGFGWSAVVPDDELLGHPVTVCGYPGDKDPWPQMWITGGEITEVTDHKLKYKNDTMPGNSGSPVYMWYKGYWTVVGIHRASSGGSCPNNATRLTNQMIRRFLEDSKNLNIYALRSFSFPDVYLRCDGEGVDDVSGSGGGIVNCQYTPPGKFEKFYIYPLEVSPSLAENPTYVVVLQNWHWDQTYIRLDGEGMTKFEGSGGGTVNCQSAKAPPGTYELFYQRRNSSGYYSFRSSRWAHCCIRLDGWGVTERTGEGGGLVNCQYFDDIHEEPGTYEHFGLELHNDS